MSIHMATTLKPNQIDMASLVSTANGNLIQVKPDGLYAALAAAPNLQNQYVSSSTGNDANDGTRAAPLKTFMRAIERLPDNTSGNIWLLEGDVFPIRGTNDPTTWGTTINYFGTVLGTGSRIITVYPYGPQTDSYAGLEQNAVNFYSWLIPSLNRPVLEFGHYLFNGKPVGSVLTLGSDAGGSCNLRGCIVRWTPEARALATSTGTPWASAGYQWCLDLANTQMMGCILPAPILTSGGSTLNHVARFVGSSQIWNTSVPAGSTPWAIIGAVSKVTYLDSGTMTDKNGATYSTVPNSTLTNAGTRIAGITRDGNGTPRNIISNAIL